MAYSDFTLEAIVEQENLQLVDGNFSSSNSLIFCSTVGNIHLSIICPTFWAFSSLFWIGFKILYLL
jgi:hypothetical protein